MASVAVAAETNNLPNAPTAEHIITAPTNFIPIIINEHILGLAVISLLFAAMVALDFFRTSRQERRLWVSLVQQIALMTGLSVGEIFVATTGLPGFLLRVGILAGVFTPVFLFTHWFRKRRDHDVS